MFFVGYCRSRRIFKATPQRRIIHTANEQGSRTPISYRIHKPNNKNINSIKKLHRCILQRVCNEKTTLKWDIERPLVRSRNKIIRNCCTKNTITRSNSKISRLYANPTNSTKQLVQGCNVEITTNSISKKLIFENDQRLKQKGSKSTEKIRFRHDIKKEASFLLPFVSLGIRGEKGELSTPIKEYHVRKIPRKIS